MTVPIYHLIDLSKQRLYSSVFSRFGKFASYSFLSAKLFRFIRVPFVNEIVEFVNANRRFFFVDSSRSPDVVSYQRIRRLREWCLMIVRIRSFSTWFEFFFFFFSYWYEIAPSRDTQFVMFVRLAKIVASFLLDVTSVSKSRIYYYYSDRRLHGAEAHTLVTRFYCIWIGAPRFILCVCVCTDLP